MYCFFFNFGCVLTVEWIPFARRSLVRPTRVLRPQPLEIRFPSVEILLGFIFVSFFLLRSLLIFLFGFFFPISFVMFAWVSEVVN